MEDGESEGAGQRGERRGTEKERERERGGEGSGNREAGRGERAAGREERDREREEREREREGVGAADKERNGWFGGRTPDLTPVQVIKKKHGGSLWFSTRDQLTYHPWEPGGTWLLEMPHTISPRTR